MDRWLPLAQYAIEEGISISTLRRKIKSNAIEYKLDDGRYLIKSTSGISRESAPVFSTRSSDSSKALEVPQLVMQPQLQPQPQIKTKTEIDLEQIRSDLYTTVAQVELKWKALEVRVNGLAKKIDYLIEQNSELNMLVKVFEEKLNATL